MKLTGVRSVNVNPYSFKINNLTYYLIFKHKFNMLNMLNNNVV